MVGTMTTLAVVTSIIAISTNIITYLIRMFQEMSSSCVLLINFKTCTG